MSSIENIWREYGFSKNPYHTEHLEPVDEDAQLYIPRDDEERQLGRFIASEDSGGIFVEGMVGVGKTTFINQTQYRLLEDDDLPDILPSNSIVEMISSTTPKSLVLDILTAVLKALRAEIDDIESNETFQQLERYSRKALIESWSGDGSVMGVGASANKNVASTDPAELTLQTLQDLLYSAAKLASEHSYDKVVILINNLDNMDSEHFFGLLHDLRDTLLTRVPYLFVFSSNIGLRRKLSTTRAHRRISEKIESDTIVLNPLSLSKVHQIIEKRVHAYKLESHSNPAPPVPAKVIDILYEASDGELRYVLNRASGVASKVADKLPSHNTIDEDLALAALKQIVRDKIEVLELTDRKWEILEKIYRFDRVQPKDYDTFDLKSAQSFSNYLTEFYEMRLLERTREGRETFYTGRGDVGLYFRDF